MEMAKCVNQDLPFEFHNRGDLRRFVFNSPAQESRMGRWETSADFNIRPGRTMNDNDSQQLLRELRLIRVCAVVFTAAFVFRIVSDFFNFHL